MIDYNIVPSPCFVIDEARLRNNLGIIKNVQERAGVKIIMALKAFAMFPVFPIIKEYIGVTTASSLGEAVLAKKHMGTLSHTYAPVYDPNEFGKITECSSHITFNSISHYEFYKDELQKAGHRISAGITINPEFSEVETDLYNPCAKGSRLGVTAAQMGDKLPDGIEGIHFHTLCESSSYDLEKTLAAVEEKFAPLLDQAKWINMGGGHLMTRKDYDTEHLISILKAFKERHKNL
jgi:carboxynorspermidine decarboxylase